RRAIPGAISFMICMVLIGVWCATSLFVVISPNQSDAIFWVKVMLAVVPYFPVLILVAVMQVIVRPVSLRPRTIPLLLIIPTITALLTFTSDRQNFYIYNIGLVQSGAQNIGWTNQYGPWSAVHLSYSYALVMFAIVVLIRQFIRLRYHTYR